MLIGGEDFEAQFVKRDTTQIFFKLSDLSDRIAKFDELAAVRPSKTDPFFNDPTKAVHVKVKFKEEGVKQSLEGFVIEMDAETMTLASYIGDFAEEITLSYEQIKTIRTLNYHASLPQGFNSAVIGLGAGILLGVSGALVAQIAAPFVTTGIILIGHNKNLTRVKYSKEGLEEFRKEYF